MLLPSSFSHHRDGQFEDPTQTPGESTCRMKATFLSVRPPCRRSSRSRRISSAIWDVSERQQVNNDIDRANAVLEALKIHTATDDQEPLREAAE